MGKGRFVVYEDFHWSLAPSWGGWSKGTVLFLRLIRAGLRACFSTEDCFWPVIQGATCTETTYDQRTSSPRLPGSCIRYFEPQKEEAVSMVVPYKEDSRTVIEYCE